MDTARTIDAIGRVLDTLDRAAVAVSGGVDSLTLAAVAVRRMGARVSMFHSMTASVPLEATARTRSLASEL